MKIDNRVRYTQAMLKESLIALIGSKSLRSISVTELCRESQINRGTFYLHYSSIEALVRQLEDEFLSDNLGAVSELWTSGGSIEKLFAKLEKSRDFLLAITSENGDPGFLPRLLRETKELVLDNWCADYAPCPREKLDIAFTFVSAGALEVMLDCFAGRSSCSLEVMTECLNTLTLHTNRAIGELRMKSRA